MASKSCGAMQVREYQGKKNLGGFIEINGVEYWINVYKSDNLEATWPYQVYIKEKQPMAKKGEAEVRQMPDSHIPF